MNRLLPATCLATLLCVPLAGCGQKGALYLPPPPAAVPDAPTPAPTPPTPTP